MICLRCHFKAKLQKIALLLCIQQIQQLLTDLSARRIQIEYSYFPMLPTSFIYYRRVDHITMQSWSYSPRILYR